MNEAEWLACTDPAPMFEYLRTQHTASERKLRLFAAACCGRIWDWLGERSRRAIEVLERYLDGEATSEELHLAAGGAYEEGLDAFGHDHSANAAFSAVMFESTHHDAALGVAAECVEAVRCVAASIRGQALHAWPQLYVVEPVVEQVCIEAGDKAMRAERAAQCHLLREVFHGPRRAVYRRSYWRTSTVLNLASTIYSEARFEELPILAVLSDALEDARCDSADILSHLRGPGPHVRGCWAVDLLLGKE
jgi:hypothetical protein